MRTGLSRKLDDELDVRIIYCTVSVTVVECCNVAPVAPVAVPVTLMV
jgi:hypothetical protein